METKEEKIHNLEAELIDIYYAFDLPKETRKKLINDLDGQIRNLKVASKNIKEK